MGPISAELPHWDNLALNLEMTLGKREGATLSRAKRGQNKALLEMGSSWPFPSKRVGEKALKKQGGGKRCTSISREKFCQRKRMQSDTLLRPTATGGSDRKGRKEFLACFVGTMPAKRKTGGSERRTESVLTLGKIYERL